MSMVDIVYIIACEDPLNRECNRAQALRKGSDFALRKGSDFAGLDLVLVVVWCVPSPMKWVETNP